MSFQNQKSLTDQLAGVKLFLCDVDGVLTDASVFVGPDCEFKRFNILDGLGQRMLQHGGIKVGWVSRRVSEATTRRAKELKVDYLHQHDVSSKVIAVESILKETGFHWEDVCYVGDDIVDIGVLKRAGVAVAVANAVAEAKAVADYVTVQPGGHGAIREVVELILKAQNKWDALVEKQFA